MIVKWSSLDLQRSSSVDICYDISVLFYDYTLNVNVKRDIVIFLSVPRVQHIRN